jgi:uncharacterized protein (TIGR03437 family)
LTRFLVLLAAASATAWGQFATLATPSDGSAVYFTTSLRLKGRLESPWGKVFAADENGVRLVVSRELRKPAPSNGNCLLGELYSFSAVELSADGKTLAAAGFRWNTGECHGAGAATLLRSATGSREINGRARLSANGRWAIVDSTSSAFSQTTGSILDLATGAETDFQMPTLGGLQFPGGRAIADDGTAVFIYGGRTFLIRPGGAPQGFPNGYPLAISATGTRLLYLSDSVHLIDLATQHDEQLGTKATTGAGTLSDDGSRAAFLQNQRLFVADFGGTGARQTGSVSETLTFAIMSGNGRIAYATTTTGGLVKIAVETGVTTEIVGRTPDISFAGGIVDAGMFTTISGVGFSDQSYSASAPLPLTLGGVSVTLDGRPLRISRVTPTAIDVLVPWEMASSAPQTLVVNSSAARSPFEAPQTTVQATSGVRAGALYRQDWSSTVSDLTVHTGEIIHVFAVGLGPVTPEVPTGSAAPSSEPLARLASAMTCTNASVLYAGLQPGTVARVYQVDLQIGTKTGYQQFPCAVGGGPSFAFLTLNVIP